MSLQPDEVGLGLPTTTAMGGGRVKTSCRNGNKHETNPAGARRELPCRLTRRWVPLFAVTDARVRFRTASVESGLPLLCQEDAQASCCARDEGGPFEAAL